MKNYRALVIINSFFLISCSTKLKIKSLLNKFSPSSFTSPITFYYKIVSVPLNDLNNFLKIPATRVVAILKVVDCFDLVWQGRTEKTYISLTC